MKFKLEIDMDGDAFQQHPSGEIARILSHVAGRFQNDHLLVSGMGGTEPDTNGNTVCRYSIRDAAAESLQFLRGVEAEVQFESYDFGPFSVQDCGGWELDTPGARMTRTVYLEDDRDVSEVPTRKATFRVVLESDTSHDTVGSYATLDGTFIP